jgi:hypothetical protein
MVERTPRWMSHPLGVPMLLLVLTLVVRLPFFFPAVLDWDESTHILIGQSLLDGYLPYVQLWTLKPPLIFAFDAAAIAVFGHSPAAVRLAGALCVATTGFLVYRFGAACWSRTAALAAAVLTIFAIGGISSGQATMTEVVLLPAFIGAVYLLLVHRGSASRLAWAGALMAVATLVRLNTAFPVLAAGLILLVEPAYRPLVRVRHLASYAAGGIVVASLVCLPYIVSGHFDLLWRSLVTAPMAYAGSQYTALTNLGEMSLHAFGISREDVGYSIEVPWASAFLWITGVLGLVVLGRLWRTLAELERRGFVLVVGCGAATAFGIVSGGAAYAHYLIQLVPLAALLTAGLLRHASPRLRIATVSLAGVAALLSLPPVISEYRTMVTRAQQGVSLHYGPAHDIASYLAKENPSGRPVFLLREHIAYWFMGTRPLTRLSAHPSNIWKQYLMEAMEGPGATSESELRRVFDQSPEFVVMARTNREWSLLNPPAWALLETILSERYELVTRIEGRPVYRRRAAAPPASGGTGASGG